MLSQVDCDFLASDSEGEESDEESDDAAPSVSEEVATQKCYPNAVDTTKRNRQQAKAVDKCNGEASAKNEGDMRDTKVRLCSCFCRCAIQH